MSVKRLLSLGVGVQSSTVALMIEHGEIAPIELAIFSNPQAERSATYAYLEWLRTVVSFPIEEVCWKKGLTSNIEASVAGGRFAGAPFFAKTPRGAGPLRRQCTREFKIQPIQRRIREWVGLEPGRPGPRKRILVEQLFGISLDEAAMRCRTSRVGWIHNAYPLVDLRMTRSDCELWLQRHGYPVPPRSACVYCPYKSNREWRELRDQDPAGWTEACRVDALIRASDRGVRDPLYVHRSLVPLPEVDLSTAEDHGQVDAFAAECEGMCGV